MVPLPLTAHRFVHAALNAVELLIKSPVVGAYIVGTGHAVPVIDLVAYVLARDDSGSGAALSILQAVLVPLPSLASKRRVQARADTLLFVASSAVVGTLSSRLGLLGARLHNAAGMQEATVVVDVVHSLLEGIRALPGDLRSSVAASTAESLGYHGLEGLLSLLASLVLDREAASVEGASSLAGKAATTLNIIGALDPPLLAKWLASNQGQQEFIHIASSILANPATPLLDQILPMLLAAPPAPPHILRAVCQLPPPFFASAALRPLVLPVIVAGVWGRPLLARLVEEEVSCEFIAQFVREQMKVGTGQRNPLSRIADKPAWEAVARWFEEGGVQENIAASSE